MAFIVKNEKWWFSIVMYFFTSPGAMFRMTCWQFLSLLKTGNIHESMVIVVICSHSSHSYPLIVGHPHPRFVGSLGCRFEDWTRWHHLHSKGETSQAMVVSRWILHTVTGENWGSRRDRTPLVYTFSKMTLKLHQQPINLNSWHFMAFSVFMLDYFMITKTMWIHVIMHDLST
jgi:hypothetical protein